MILSVWWAVWWERSLCIYHLPRVPHMNNLGICKNVVDKSRSKAVNLNAELMLLERLVFSISITEWFIIADCNTFANRYVISSACSANWFLHWPFQAHVLVLAVVLWALRPVSRSHCSGPGTPEFRYSFLVVGPDSRVNIFATLSTLHSFGF